MSFCDFDIYKVVKDHKLFIVDANGRMINSEPYDSIDYYYEDDYARVRRNSKIGFVDKFGNEVVKCIYDSIRKLYDDTSLAIVYRNDMCGVVDYEGKESIPCIYESSGKITKGWKMFKTNYRWLILDKYGNEI